MQDYTTKDFYFAAYLTASGIELQKYSRNLGLTVFVFENSQELQTLVKKFYESTALVNPIVYGHAVRELKSVIHTISNQNENHVQQFRTTK